MLQWKIPCVRQWQSEISCAANKTQWNLSKEKRENGIAKGSLEAGQRCKHVTHQFYKAQSLPPGVVISTGSKSLIMTAGSKQKWEKWKRHDPTVLAKYATAKKEMGGGSALLPTKGFLSYSSRGEMSDTVKDPSVMAVSCTGLQSLQIHSPLHSVPPQPPPKHQPALWPRHQPEREDGGSGVFTPPPQAHCRLAAPPPRGRVSIPRTLSFPPLTPPGPEELALGDHPVLVDFPKPVHLLVSGSWSLRGYLVQPVSYQNPNRYIQH